MNTYQFLEMYLELQRDIMFDSIEEFEFSKIYYKNIDTSPFWNNALIKKTLNQNQIHEAEERFQYLHRKPAFYFENIEEMNTFFALLKQKEYKQTAEDSFLFHSGENIGELNFDLIKKVTDKQN